MNQEYHCALDTMNSSEIRERHVFTHPNTLAYFTARQCVQNLARICLGQLIRPFVWGWRVTVTGDELVKLHRRLAGEGHVHCICCPGSLSTCSVPIQIISEARLKIARGEVKKYVSFFTFESICLALLTKVVSVK